MEIDPLTNVITNFPLEEKFLQLVVLIGGFNSILKSSFQSMVIVYIGIVFYLTTFIQLLFPKKKEDGIEMVDVQLKPSD
jgi:hypothetical protein